MTRDLATKHFVKYIGTYYGGELSKIARREFIVAWRDKARRDDPNGAKMTRMHHNPYRFPIVGNSIQPILS